MSDGPDESSLGSSRSAICLGTEITETNNNSSYNLSLIFI